ncbi:MAG: HupE/UreJ family protein [Nannocystaceae bacterium]
MRGRPAPRGALLLPVVGVLAALLVAAPARAHDVAGEVLFLDFGERAIGVELQIPPGQLEAARRAAAASEVDLRDWVRDRLTARTEDGRPFTTEITDVARTWVGDGEVYVARGRLVAPDGAAPRRFLLRDDVVLERVATHNVYVFARRDLRLADTGEAPTLVASAHYQRREVAVTRPEGSLRAAFAAMFALGLGHIAEGTDHLLFLLTLLMVAPLRAVGRRWAAARSVRETLWRVVKIVSAFTLGHSLTLALGATIGVSVSAQLVEVVVALSILVSAVHVLVPLFPEREGWIAGLFGLFHGLAFASALGGFGYDGATQTLALLAFNLGVEAMQLLIVAAVIPWLIILRRSPAYALLCAAAATFAAFASVGWTVERIAGLEATLPSQLAEAVAAQAPWCIVGLAAAALTHHLVGTDLPRAPSAPASSGRTS